MGSVANEAVSEASRSRLFTAPELKAFCRVDNPDFAADCPIRPANGPASRMTCPREPTHLSGGRFRAPPDRVRVAFFRIVRHAGSDLGRCPQSAGPPKQSRQQVGDARSCGRIKTNPEKPSRGRPTGAEAITQKYPGPMQTKIRAATALFGAGSRGGARSATAAGIPQRHRPRTELILYIRFRPGTTAGCSGRVERNRTASKPPVRADRCFSRPLGPAAILSESGCHRTILARVRPAVRPAVRFCAQGPDPGIPGELPSSPLPMPSPRSSAELWEGSKPGTHRLRPSPVGEA